jgi:hypothetical protein
LNFFELQLFYTHQWFLFPNWFFNLNFALWYIFWMSNIFELICWLSWHLIFILCCLLIPVDLSFILNCWTFFIFEYFTLKIFKSQLNIKIEFSWLINLSSIDLIWWNKPLNFH